MKREETSENKKKRKDKGQKTDRETEKKTAGHFIAI